MIDLLSDAKRLIDIAKVLTVFLLVIWLFTLLMIWSIPIVLPEVTVWIRTAIGSEISRERDRKSHFLVPASKLWIDSGITITPGQIIRISASGLINVAMHRVVNAAEEDKYPLLPWTGPEGFYSGPNETRPIYSKRRYILVKPDAPRGSLLLYARKQGYPEPGKHNPDPSDIVVVGKGITYTYEAVDTMPANLYFVINDAVLGKEKKHRDAFMGTQSEIDFTYGKGRYSVEELEKRWNKIVETQYWDIWYHDNVGQFLVEVGIQ